MKKVIALILVCSILTISACQNEEPQEPMEMSVDMTTPIDAIPTDETSVTDETVPDTYEVEAKKYTVKEAFEKVFSDLGQDEESINAKLSEYGLTIKTVKNRLTGEYNTDIRLAQVLNLSGIGNEQVDWTTSYTYKDIQIPAGVVEIPVDILTDTKEFSSYVQRFGVSSFDFLKDDAAGFIEPDYREMENMVSSKFEIPQPFPAYSGLNVYGNYVKYTDSSAKSYYELVRETERSGSSDVITAYSMFYPVIERYGAGVPVYMKDLSENTGAPLWQIYFVAYVNSIKRHFNFDTDGYFIETMSDGIQVWWALKNQQGMFIELDVYESGLIRIVMARDLRIDSFDITPIREGIEGDTTPVDAGTEYPSYSVLYESLVGTYNITIEQWDDIIKYAVELRCPFITTLSTNPEDLSSDATKGWMQFIPVYLETIDKWKKGSPSECKLLDYYSTIADLAMTEQEQSVIDTLKELQLKYQTDYADQDGPILDVFLDNPDLIEKFTDYMSGIARVVGNYEGINLNYNLWEGTPTQEVPTTGTNW